MVNIETEALINHLITPTIVVNCLAIRFLCTKELRKTFKNNSELFVVIIYGILLNILLHNFDFSLDTILNGFLLSNSSIGIYYLFKRL